MKKKCFAVFATALFFASCNNEKTSGESTVEKTDSTTTMKTEKKAWVPVDSATAMQKYMEVATPGEPHKILAESDGKWTGQATTWMEKGGPAMTSTVKMNNKMAMDGRYQISTTTGNMAGMPFEGTATNGYDNYKKKYFSSWIDNMGTGLLVMEGTYDPATKTLTYTGTFPNPANGAECEMKETYRMIDPNTAEMELWGTDMKTGETYKTMEIKLTKDK
ncbi:MAG: DUF1579 domain-containing protein [Chitinophagaceae bacterium]